MVVQLKILNYVTTTFMYLLVINTYALAHTIPGINSIRTQFQLRANNKIDVIYNNLLDEELDFINHHLTNLIDFNGSDCDACKHKIKYGQTLLHDDPSKQHLISLLMFKYCLEQNNDVESKCDNVDFFITTKDQGNVKAVGEYDSNISESTAINLYDNDFMHMLKNFNTSSDIDLEYYCYYKSNVCSLPELPDVYVEYNLSSWWPEKKEKFNSQPKYTNNSETFNVLHITDFHLQSRYKVGSESNCTSGLCCLPESYDKSLISQDHNFSNYYFELDPFLTNISYSFYPDAHYDKNNTYIKGNYYDFPKNRGYNFNSLPATTFGGYNCDSPEVLLNNTLKYISEAHLNKSFEFTIFTGDLVDHDVIHCDAELTKNEEILSLSLMKEFLGQIPVFPTLGNHDTFPYGQIAPLDYDFNNAYSWNADLMTELWVSNGWLPDEPKSFVKNHYAGFSYVTDRNLKIISLNSNCYYQKNLWSYINLSQEPDLFGQWKFLIDELVESESQGQRVWIISHIPASDADSLPIQSKIFSEIVKRFSPYTIANIFYGHTHRDQFHIFASSNNSSEAEEIINMAWVAQSVTPYVDNNPSWRYYEVENESFNIRNSFNYYAKLNETFTNGGDEPEWYFEYSARSLYDSDGEWPETAPLNATFWNEFVLQKLKNQSNIEFNQLYSNIQYRYTPNVPNCKNGTVISDTCYNENYCVAANFLSQEYRECLRH